MTIEGSNKIVNVMTPGQGSFARAWPFKSYTEIAFIYFLKKLLHNQELIRQTERTVRVYQTCKFYDPQGMGSFARAWI